MKPVSEVLTHHVDEQNVLYVDVYHTTDENEQGKTVAYVCLDTLKVIYSDKIYSRITTVQNAIKEVLEQHKKPVVTVVMTDYEDVYVYVNDELWTFNDYVLKFDSESEAIIDVIKDEITTIGNIKSRYIEGSKWLDVDNGNPPNSLKEFINLGD